MAPLLWFAIAFAVLWAATREPLARAAPAAAALTVACLLAWPDPARERWSPYYRIQTLENGDDLLIRVNSDHMTHLPLVPSPPPPSPGAPLAERALFHPPRHVPFLFAPPDRVLILGSGGGVDVAETLAAGARAVDAVEIDPVIQDLAETRNADRPYEDPRVTAHVTDARAFVRTATGPYSHVIYSFLDSQRILGWLSNIRLDNYVYTVEALQDALRLLDPERGILALYFSINRDWIGKKLHGLLAAASGRPPLVLAHGDLRVFLAGPGVPDRIPTALTEIFANGAALYRDASDVTIPTDDWPQLYYKRRGLSGAYLAALGAILLGTAWALRHHVGGRSAAFFFLMGAGFLLVETWALTQCGLLFGATWIVNPIVLSAVLGVSLLAALAERPLPATLLWAGVFGALAACLLFPRGALLALPSSGRALAAGALFGLPLFFTGKIFADALAAAPDARRAFGANLLGSVFGGILEFSSLAWGNHLVLALAAALYLGACLLHKTAKPTAAASR